MKSLILFASLFVCATSFSQTKYITQTGKVEFFSKATLEDIQASNKTVAVAIDSKTGAIQFRLQMKDFEFEKKLMQQHFNDNYVESDKYPQADFKGTITNNSSINYKKDGSYPAKVKGQLTLHGVTKDVETTGTIKVTGGKLDVTSAFDILLSDYKVNIPSMTKDKISNSIKITVSALMELSK